jgi:hypothetical protein
MNIFILDEDVKKAAEYHVDKHIGKMILESCQLLQMTVELADSPDFNKFFKKVLPHAKPTYKTNSMHINHPCAKWVRLNPINYLYLCSLTYALSDEYKRRKGKTHASFTNTLNSGCLPTDRSIFDKLPSILNLDLTYLPCVPEEYKVGNVIESYREYYRKAKTHLHSWTNSEEPYWIKE